MGIRRQQWMPFRPPLLPADKPTSIKHRVWYKYIDFYINLLNSTKPFDSGLEKWMHKAARHSGSVVSSNPCHWRGKRLHHHGGGVCWLFVLLWMDSWRHKLIVCKKWYKNNLKMRLTALLFDPPRRAPHRQWMVLADCCMPRRRVGGTEAAMERWRPPWLKPVSGANFVSVLCTVLRGSNRRSHRK